MAKFAVVSDDEGNRLKYKAERDLYNLVDYCIRNSKYTDVNEMVPGNTMVLKNQFLYAQDCKGEVLDTRALHFVLSFDSNEWEWEINVNKTIECIGILKWLRNQFGLEQYDMIFSVHDNQKNCHIHIIVNPVSKVTRKILHYNQNEFKYFLKELARCLYMKYGLALSGVSYINEDGRCCWGNSPILYENRQYSYEKLRS